VSTWLAIRARLAERAATSAAEQARLERNRAILAESEARADRDRTATAERTTRSEADKVKAINAFLTEDILTQAEPGKNAAVDKVSLLEVLDRAAAKVGERFRDRPEIEVVLRRAMYDTYHGLGAWAKAEQQVAAQLELERRLHGEEGTESLLALSVLGHIRDHLGRTDEALSALQRASEGLQRRLGAGHPNAIAIRTSLAVAYRSAGRTAEAIAMLEDLQKLGTANLGPDHPHIPGIRENLAMAYRSGGRTAEAVAILEEMLARMTAKLGPDHHDLLRVRTNLANAYLSAGRTAEAIPLLEETLARTTARFGPVHPQTFAVRSNLANAYLVGGRTDKAIPLMEEMLEWGMAKLGPDHPLTLSARNNLAGAYWTAGRTAEAIPLMEETYKRRLAKLGPDHPGTLTGRANLGRAYWSAGRAAEAVATLEETIPRMAAKLGPDHPDTVSARSTLAMEYESTGRPGDAESLRRAILETCRRAQPGDPVTLSDALSWLGRNLLLQQKFAEARPFLRESLEISEKASPAEWTAWEARSVLGASFAGGRSFAEAEPLILSGYEGMKAREASIPPSDRPRLAEAAARVVRLYEAWGKPEKAEEWRRRLGPADLPADPFHR
jgi:tetratricopeptide (TPR) repeat protein